MFVQTLDILERPLYFPTMAIEFKDGIDLDARSLCLQR